MRRERIPRQPTVSGSVAPATPSSTNLNVITNLVTTASNQTRFSLDPATDSRARIDFWCDVCDKLDLASPLDLDEREFIFFVDVCQHFDHVEFDRGDKSTSRASTSTVSSTTSTTPTPSSSSTSSTVSSSLSVSPSSTTQPLISSSSQQGIPTTVTSAYTTFINGSMILTQTAFPSTIPQLSGPSSGARTAIIAGSAAGGTALLILLLSLAFCARRKQFKRLDFVQAIMLKRKQERSRATLLDGEDLDDVDLARPPRRYTDYDTPWDTRDSRDDSTRGLMVGRTTPGVRWPETVGSASSRDGVWPAPAANEGTRLIDSVADRDDLDLDLGRIVDDVMGPSSSAVHFSDQSVASVHRASMAESEAVMHSRTASNASNTALLEAAGMGMTTTPVRSSPLAQLGTKPGGGSVEHQTEDGP